MKKILIAVIVLALLATAIWFMTRPKPAVVALADVETGLVASTVANTRAGTVKACRRARLAPPLSGQIAKLPAHEGDEVEAGQVLLELWNEDIRAEVLLAERDATASRAQAEQVCVTADVSKREAERIRRLRQQGLTSEENLDIAEGDAKAKRAACRAAKSLVTVRDARVDATKALLERTILRAPFSGTVAEVNGEVGEVVTPSPVGIQTPPAVDLVDNSCLYISAPIDEVDAPAIVVGMPARITLDAFPERDFTGHVRRIAPYVLDLEKQARTVEIEVEVEETAAGLLPGYSADVEVMLDERDDVLRIPTQSILEDNRVLVYVAADETLAERTVETGLSNWEFTEIVSGLNAGERVVISVDREGAVAGAHVEPE